MLLDLAGTIYADSLEELESEAEAEKQQCPYGQ
jgi:hypothetical protein